MGTFYFPAVQSILYLATIILYCKCSNLWEQKRYICTFLLMANKICQCNHSNFHRRKWVQLLSPSFLTTPHALPSVFAHTMITNEYWNVCSEETLNICSWSGGFILYIWNTKTRALSFTISNNTHFFIYTGTKLWTGDQCSGQTHLI